MKIEITERYHNDLIMHKKDLLLIKKETLLCYVEDFEVDEVDEIKTYWFKPNEIVKVKYLTKLKVVYYDKHEKSLCYLPEEYIELLFIFRNLRTLRQDWNEFKNQLSAYGIEIKKFKEEITESQITHPKCKGIRTYSWDNDGCECEYNTTLTCNECRYGNEGGKKDPEAKRNQIK